MRDARPRIEGSFLLPPFLNPHVKSRVPTFVSERSSCSGTFDHFEVLRACFRFLVETDSTPLTFHLALLSFVSFISACIVFWSGAPTPFRRDSTWRNAGRCPTERIPFPLAIASSFPLSEAVRQEHILLRIVPSPLGLCQCRFYPDCGDIFSPAP